MAKGDKPCFKVTGKRKPNAPQDLPQYIDILAGWDAPERPGGLSTMWDRRIVSVTVQDRDGRTATLDLSDYYCNIRDERREDAPRRREQKREAPADGPPPDFGPPPDDSDIPF